MKRTSLQFGITHLLTLITMIAFTIALFRWHVVAGFVATPLLLGPAAGSMAMRDRAGALIGLLSAVYWSIVAVLTTTFVAIAAAPLINWELSPIVVASLIGGYVGGRVAAAGVVIRV